MAVAVFNQPDIIGTAVATDTPYGCKLVATFTKLPPGKHGFHIHAAGDLRYVGCAGACSHWSKKAATHGGRPGDTAERHTGDLGNIEVGSYRYRLVGVKPNELWGRTLIIHADEDDLGKGSHEDSTTTGHSGARIGCAIFGRTTNCIRNTRKATKFTQS